ncbi:MAG: ABC transporter ATP-binding protein [Thermoplasmata archaeon]
MSVIETKNVFKRFGDFDALENVNVRVEEGEFFGLCGPNGAGKTTLLRILTGQLEPTEGMARVLSIDSVKEPLGVKQLIGIVPEVESPPSYLTAYEFLYFVCNVRNVSKSESKIHQWMDFFDLSQNEGVVCRDLSKGNRQKLMLASAFIHEPTVLFLDEPLINLDPLYQRKVKVYLSDYVRKRGTIFMCTHLLDMAEKLCSSVAIINDGRIIIRHSIGKLLDRFESLENAFIHLVHEKRGSG